VFAFVEEKELNKFFVSQSLEYGIYNRKKKIGRRGRISVSGGKVRPE
jgi:hypothetical protein